MQAETHVTSSSFLTFVFVLFVLYFWPLVKIEHFIVIRGKVPIAQRASQDFVFVVHFYWSTVRGTYLCRWFALGSANAQTRSISKRWTITWMLKNCIIFKFRHAFERWQSFAIFQREDEGTESLAPGPILNGLFPFPAKYDNINKKSQRSSCSPPLPEYETNRK